MILGAQQLFFLFRHVPPASLIHGDAFRPENAARSAYLRVSLQFIAAAIYVLVRMQIIARFLATELLQASFHCFLNQ